MHDQSVKSTDVHIGPSDYVPWLKDNKVALIRIESRHFGDVPMNIELRLSVEDSPNSAGVVIDAIRCCKLAMDNKIGGPLIGPSAYFMKSPPVQFTDATAREKVEEFIKKYSKLPISVDNSLKNGIKRQNGKHYEAAFSYVEAPDRDLLK